jgi:hypothetical protein
VIYSPKKRIKNSGILAFLLVEQVPGIASGSSADAIRTILTSAIDRANTEVHAL